MDTLFKEDLDVLLPPQFEFAGKVHGAVLKKIRYPGSKLATTANEFSEKRLQALFLQCLDGQREIAVVPRKTDVALDCQEILRHPAASSLSAFRAATQPGLWIKPAPLDPANVDIQAFDATLSDIRSSWRGAFDYREETLVGDVVIQSGLRKPQIGRFTRLSVTGLRRLRPRPS